MAARSGGISGLGIALATAGALLVYSGIRSVSPLSALRSIMQGTLPTGTPATPATIPSELQFVEAGAVAGADAAASGLSATTLGGKIVAAAQKYIGVPYKWGGASPSGFDCSGLVTYVLHHDLGMNLPSNSHTVAAQFLVWGGATTLANGDAIQPGDLVCWAGHIGIATDATNMIDAPQTGETVKLQRVWHVPAPVYRRVKDQSGSASAAAAGAAAAGSLPSPLANQGTVNA